MQVKKILGKIYLKILPQFFFDFLGINANSRASCQKLNLSSILKNTTYLNEVFRTTNHWTSI